MLVDEAHNEPDFGDMEIRHGFGEGTSPTLVDDMINVRWTRTEVTPDVASPIATNGHAYLTDGSGMIVVIADGPQLEVAAENDMGEGIDATPAAVGDALYIRGERHLFCVGQ